MRVRGARGSYAFVGANGGWMSKYSAGVYSTEPADWSAGDRFEVVAKADDAVAQHSGTFENAAVESYTINRTKKGDTAIWIGRESGGKRVIGNADLSDEATRAAFEGGEPFGAKLNVMQDERGRNIARIAS